MKRLFFFLFTLFLVGHVQAQSIRFEKYKTWNDVLAKAKAENKLIFLDAYTTWCGPCKYMQRDVFHRPAVARFYNAQFINVKMDMEQGEGPALAQQFALTAVPALLFINGDGKVVHRYEGALAAKEFIALGKEAIAPAL